jgi:Beta-galactosidase
MKQNQVNKALLTGTIICLTSGILFAGKTTAATPEGKKNIVRNSSFEHGKYYNGTPMRNGTWEHYRRILECSKKPRWKSTLFEAWWTNDSDDSQVKISTDSRTGKRSMLLEAATKPVKVYSAYDRVIDKGMVTLSAYIKTKNATASISLILTNGKKKNPNLIARKEIRLPANMSAWTRITVSLNTTRKCRPAMKLLLSRGQVKIDDVQIEQGTTATAFIPTPNEWLTLSFKGENEELLPKWRYGQARKKTLTLTNSSSSAITGQVEVFYGPWNAPKKYKTATFKLNNFAPEASRNIILNLSKLLPDAYIASVVLTQKGKIIFDGTDYFHPYRKTGGRVSDGMLSARCAIRFSIFPATMPKNIFGVGNGMLFTGGHWYTGVGINDYVHAGKLGITCARDNVNEDRFYVNSAAKAPIHARRPRIDQARAKEISAFCNPTNNKFVDIFNPAGQKFMAQRAFETGKKFRNNPGIASFQMSNESIYFNHKHLCPSVYADKNFREWCRRKHGSLKNLNASWNTRYKNWDEVEQIVSARLADMMKNAPKKKGADWLAATGTLKKCHKIMQSNPGRAMDWLRWQTETSLKMYSDFRKNARKFDKKTLYSTNLCWPSFWPQMFMRFIRAMDVTMLDAQYTSGFKRALGTPTEMMDIMEMSESVAPNKPIWGIEIYVQPTFPPEYVAMQNWGLLAHGMTNNLVFAWKPYSDHGTIKTTRAWEKEKAPPMWMMIDKDGTKLPQYKYCEKSMREIESFHKKYDGLSIKRTKSNIAYYISPDTGEYVILETANRPWMSFYQKARSTLVYGLRLNGITLDYVDNLTLPGTSAKYKVLLLPATPVMSQEAARKIARFARSGGTVILTGPCGVYDDWLKSYINIGGRAWSDLKWKTPPQWKSYNKLKLGKFKGLAYLREPAALTTPKNTKPIKLPDGSVIGFRRKWGKGQLVFYKVFPAFGSAHLPRMCQAWFDSVIKQASMDKTAWWNTLKANQEGRKTGTGKPVVEVVLRDKSAKEKFVFCMNQGGLGSGEVNVTVSSPVTNAEDVITGKRLGGSMKTPTRWSMPMSIKPWEYRVIRLTLK